MNFQFSLFLFVSTFLVASCVHGAVISFNNSMISRCGLLEGGCDIADPSIYEGSVLPAANDTLSVALPDPSPSPVLLYLAPSSSLALAALRLAGNATVEVRGNATLRAGNLTLSDAEVRVLPTASLVVSVLVAIDGASLLRLEGSFSQGSLYVKNSPIIFLSNASSILASSGSSYISYALSQKFQGTLDFAENSTFTVFGFALFDGSELNFLNIPFVGYATFENVNANFEAGLNGYGATLINSNITVHRYLGDEPGSVGSAFGNISLDEFSTLSMLNAEGTFLSLFNGQGIFGPGKFVISSSQLAVYGLTSPINATLVLAGNTTLELYPQLPLDLSLKRSLVQFANAEDGTRPYITLGVYKGIFSLYGDWEIPGELNIGDSMVTLDGNISFTGGLYSDVYYGRPQITVNGSLTCGGPIVLSNYYPTEYVHFFVASNAIITTPSFEVYGNFSLYSRNTSKFVGDLINNAIVHVTQTDNIVVEGNYVQLSNGTLAAYNLTSSKNASVNLVVSGNASLSGKLHYNVTAQPKKKVVFTVLSAGHVNGSFAKALVPAQSLVSAKKLTASVGYTANYVRVSIQSSTLQYLGLAWWIWVSIGGGTVVLAVLGIVIVKRSTNRKQYKPIE